MRFLVRIRYVYVVERPVTTNRAGSRIGYQRQRVSDLLSCRPGPVIPPQSVRTNTIQHPFRSCAAAGYRRHVFETKGRRYVAVLLTCDSQDNIPFVHNNSPYRISYRVVRAVIRANVPGVIGPTESAGRITPRSWNQRLLQTRVRTEDTSRCSRGHLAVARRQRAPDISCA